MTRRRFLQLLTGVITRLSLLLKWAGNPATRRYTTVPNHPGDMPEGTLRFILKQADMEPDLFLSA